MISSTIESDDLVICGLAIKVSIREVLIKNFKIQRNFKHYFNRAHERRCFKSGSRIASGQVNDLLIFKKKSITKLGLRTFKKIFDAFKFVKKVVHG